MDKLLKRIVLVAVLFTVFLVAFKLYNTKQVKATLKTPVVELTASNDKTYAAGQAILPEDFTVKEKHENGKTVTLDTDDFTLQPEVAAHTGATTPVVITKASDPSWTCEVDVKNKRVEVISFDVGYPNLEDVKATIYSNGELEFTGKGNVKNYEKKKMPWETYEDADDNPIVSVVFQDGVEPISMDYWFKGQEELKYINKIPASVQSMEYTLADCPSLETGPDWTACNALTNLTGTFSEDTSLTYVYPIPSSVTVMDAICSECTSLEIAPDMSEAVSVVYMQESFASCISLHEIGNLPPNVQSLSNAFYECINLEVAPQIPETVLSMPKTFNKCMALKTASAIPASVKDLSSTYAECPKLCGTLVIDANPDKYGSFLSKSVVSVSLNLTGSSQMLNILGLTRDDTANITVNGNNPVKE